MSKEERFEIFNEDGKWVIKDNEQLPHLLDLYKSCVRLNEFVNKIADLEAKLALYNEVIDERQDDIETLHLIRENLEQQLAEKEKQLEIYKKQFNEQVWLCEEFRFQLEEKEKEIKDLTLARFESETNKPVLTTTEIINQDKISFCIEKLEEVKENIKKCNYKDFGIMYQSDAIKQIDNQIKQLKEME